ncbi:MAG: glycosyltransferase, partial [Microbacterium sp.]
SNPHVDFVPGWLLNRQFNTPYVMDYRDSWGLDLFTGKHATGRSSRAWRLERSMLQRAQEIWFVNHPIRDWYAKEVPPAAERMHVVANGYDGDLGAAVAAARRTTRTKGSRPVRAGHGLTFGYLGTLYGAVPLRELLEGWRTTRRSVPELENARLVLRGHLGHYDVPDAKTVELLAEFSNDGVIHGGAVPKAAVAEAYAQFDVLVLPLIAGRFITSGKVFEYAATGLPIVSIHGRESAAVTILEGYPAWVLTKSLSAPDVARALAKAARLARSATESSSAENRRWAQRYSRSRQLEPRVTALSDLVSARPSRSGRDDQVSLKPQPVTPAPVDHRPVLTRSTAWVDGRHGPQQRVILLTGGSKPADQILFDEHHSAEVDFSILLGPTNSPARLTLVCRTPPEREIVGVAEILEVAAAPHSASRAARSIRYQSVDRALRRSLPGRVLASLSPLDDARELARSTRMNQRVYAALDGSDLVVAVDRAAVRTAAQWLRQRLTPAAVYGLPAAARRAHRAG